jgi:lantibiotic modifying enzyme
MGHGAAGIGYSLYRLYAHKERKRYREAADDTVRFENVFYSKHEENWKSNWTSPPYYSFWWCFGLSGIGLSRLGSLEYVESPELTRDLDRAKSFEPKLASTDTVCHGTFSQIDFLLELGRKYGNEYFREARNLAASSIDRRKETKTYKVTLGDIEGIYNPTFFLGTAGIGYTILRLLQPDGLPSILRFE